MIIRAINISKLFPGIKEKVHAVNNISIDINPGDYIAFTGPSGSGKSTLLALLGSLIMPTQGEVYLDAHVTARTSDAQLSAIRACEFGFVFQNKVMIDHLTAWENLLAPTIFRPDIPKNESVAYAHELIEQLELTGRRRFFPLKMSGGELQRLAIARALINRPKILFADEPTGDLDDKTSNIVSRLFTELNTHHNLAIVMVTHNQELARTAKNVYELSAGSIRKMIK